MSDDGSLALLLLGPGGGTALYWMLYRYYRNTDKSHAFESETKVEHDEITGSEVKVGTNNGTQESSITGDNRYEYRNRVERVDYDTG